MIYIFCFIYLLFSITSQNEPTKSIVTVLNAKWPYTDIIMETAEYLADEDPEIFWSFIDRCVDFFKNDSEKKNDEYIYKKFILPTVGLYLTEEKKKLLKFALSLRLYSPRIEMFRQIAIDRQIPNNCSVVIDVNNNLFCDLKEFPEIQHVEENSKLYQFDHHYPGAEYSSLKVILYGSVTDKKFHHIHQYFKELSVKGSIDYVYRPFAAGKVNQKVSLSGYGVELAIKSTEYKAQDDTQIKVEEDIFDKTEEEDELEGFIFDKLRLLYPDEEENLEIFRKQLLESTNELTPLKVWQLQDLSLQATERIMTTPAVYALKELMTLSQNFPILARSLIRTNVKSALKNEIIKNQKLFNDELNVLPQDAALYINGRYFDVETLDVFTLFEFLRAELRIMEALHNFGFDKNSSKQLLQLGFQTEDDEFVLDFRDSAVQFINNIETDDFYSMWPISLMEMLRPIFPGMLRPVRRNIYHVVLIFNPVQLSGFNLVKLLESFYVNRFPLCIGLLFAVNGSVNETGNNNPGIAIIEAFNYITEKKSAQDAFSFLSELYNNIGDRDVETEDVLNHFISKFSSVNINEIFGEDSNYDYGRQLSKEYLLRTGISTFPKVLINGVPLSEKEMQIDSFEDAILTHISKITKLLTQSLIKGELNDENDVLDFLMRQSNVLPRLNEVILNAKDNYLDFSSGKNKNVSITDLQNSNIGDILLTALHNLPYVELYSAEQKIRFHNVWLIFNPFSQHNLELMLEALSYLENSYSMRLLCLFNVPEQLTNNEKYFLKAVYIGLSYLPEKYKLKYAIFLFKKFKEKLSSKESIKLSDFSGMDLSLIENLIEKNDLNFIKLHHIFLEKVISFHKDNWGIIANGKVFGPFLNGTTFIKNDFHLIEKFLESKITKKLIEQLTVFKDLKLNIEDYNFIIPVLCSLFLSNPSSKSRTQFPELFQQHSVVKLDSERENVSAFEITAIVDPLSRGAQKLSSILSVLSKVVNADLRVFMNPQIKHSELPLKNFYRFVLESELKFAEGIRETPAANFINMPVNSWLTLNMHVPDNWLVEVIDSAYDLDNIHLADVKSGIVHSIYELEYLLLEGHCFEQQSGIPPRGLQFILTTDKNLIQMDTIVMANLGYFQLKANPGVWSLNLREGRSADIYDIINYEGAGIERQDNNLQVFISSFKSNVIRVKVSKKNNKLEEELLQDEPKPGLWNSITSSFSGKLQDRDEIINIFSIASGHLYERFLRIMMLSVIKHTQTPVKFWFLKNFISPQFKEFLPYMANEYAFQYEFVQYKWPRWLLQQTEKQRIIWGYKILFLDVLFPLDVKKIIFIDADQVVRADMKELMDLDLDGAPYGYTPFCSSRKEMDGYRFWKSGYWKSHLAHRPYHISALYVVDLKKFRVIAAGDRLRGQYQGLSQDPNSLSNLDQDLPNNMIHQVTIKSLPQEWLWCETWCDEASKKYAKTIDLCNNPMTKEAKLKAAIRIIPEWIDYDMEIKHLQEKIQKAKNISNEKSSLFHRNNGEIAHEEL